jgi:hypothetical protein
MTEIVFEGVSAGQSFRLAIYQDAVGNNKAVWPVMGWPDHTVPVLSTAPSSFDVVACYALDESTIIGWLAARNFGIPAG